MVPLLLSLLLDLTAAVPPSTTRDGLTLSLELHGGSVRDGQQVTAVGRLRNTSGKPMRIVWERSGEQALTLFVDGEEHKLPFGVSTAALLGWVELAPGESRTASLPLVLGPGPHTIGWRYAVDRGPYGRPVERCWSGKLSTEQAVRVPLSP
jgi:hypothetical protein